ncbi:cellulase family glycosylhydrolase [Paenibacillus harenae]|uniref:Aryl-phospho-beta-D-glucosidase BglC (GH1 family) n=1 Tax=Paenibacillus harenae TaxID=306543 RepID=A0ABT9U1H1_PAEHA|nr:cellulase family glycosylhydrolase [Paenibacillus harenae]MDQ0113491.1 aryl-phospho-beta-D-glucosidase BglC (GH1 family) [Paenibacillus harenae]
MFTPNKHFRIFLIVSILLAMIVPSASAASEERPAVGVPKSKMQSYVEAMQPGWNLGNTFDATGADETSWGNPRVTKQLIQHIASQGFKSIRIPITWDHRMGEAPDYTVDPAFMDRVEEVVNWSLDAGLYVMINLHHDSWLWVNRMGTEHDLVLDRYNAAWTQIADRFKNYPKELSFESVNEPRFSDGWGNSGDAHFAMLNELNTSFHEIVRGSGGENAERPLVLPTLETNANQDRLDALVDTFTELNDPNLIATVHYYGFWPFSVNIAGFTRFNEETKNDVIQTFDRVYQSLVAKGIPVILGEYGLLGFDKNTGTIEQGEKLKFFEFLLHYIQEKGITHMLWDNGQHLDRNELQWNDPQLYGMLKASWKGRSATAETDLIYLAKNAAAQDTAIPLELNGNRLTALRHDGKNLRKGTEYSVEGDVLIVKASLLSKLTASGAYGENAEITAKFNKGQDWTFDVIVYDTPVLHDISGTADDFSIPVAFNGDRLATMEAVYAAGGNAGPQNWTSFKEFAYTFSPSYDTNEIKLTQNFFNEVNDGEVVLTFHFWSGTTVEYRINKSGNVITGSAA